VIDVARKGVRSVANALVEFVTTPKGPFETVDEIVKTTRETARDVLKTVGLPTLGGQRLLEIRPVEELRRRVRGILRV